MPDHAMLGANRSACDVPIANQELHHLDLGEHTRLPRRLDRCLHLWDGREIGGEQPAGWLVLGGGGHDVPRLGQIEHDAGRLDRLDFVGHIPDTHLDDSQAAGRTTSPRPFWHVLRGLPSAPR